MKKVNVQTYKRVLLSFFLFASLFTINISQAQRVTSDAQQKLKSAYNNNVGSVAQIAHVRKF